MESNWQEAEQLAKQAFDLNPAHPLAKTVRTLILDQKRETLVSECVSQARKLQAAGDLAGALSRVEEGLSSYPREPRLIQIRDAVQRDFRLSAARRGAAISKNCVAWRAKPIPLTMPARSRPLGESASAGGQVSRRRRSRLQRQRTSAEAEPARSYGKGNEPGSHFRRDTVIRLCADNRRCAAEDGASRGFCLRSIERRAAADRRSTQTAPAPCHQRPRHAPRP